MLHRLRLARSFQDFRSAPASASQLLKVKLAGLRSSRLRFHAVRRARQSVSNPHSPAVTFAVDPWIAFNVPIESWAMMGTGVRASGIRGGEEQ